MYQSNKHIRATLKAAFAFPASLFLLKALCLLGICGRPSDSCNEHAELFVHWLIYVLIGEREGGREERRFTTGPWEEAPCLSPPVSATLCPAAFLSHIGI